MSYGNQQDRNDYNIGSSQSAQANFEKVAGMLEAALTRRDSDVKAAMAAYQADGVSDRYTVMEQKWNQAGGEVRGIINTVRNTLASNDDLAAQALHKAASFVP